METVWSWRSVETPAPIDLRRPLSWLCAGLLHVVALATLAAVVGPAHAPADAPPARVARESAPPPRIVFLPSEGVGGGGGGGGNRQPGPIRQAQGPGRDRVTLHVKPPIATPNRVADAEPSIGHVVLDATPLGSGGVPLLGLPEGGVSYGTSLGPGSGGGVGTGTGSGIGSGSGPGLGPGSGGGTGGGVYRVGGAVTAPRLIEQVRPSYTDAALANRIQGSVHLEVVVTRLGRPGAMRVVRSLDAGLDEQAMLAVRQWRFEPGRLGGEPVDVLVTIVLDFRIH